MEIKYWRKIKEFHGVELLRDPETMQCRIVPIERPQPQQTQESPDIDPGRQAWLDGAYAKCLANQAVKATPAAIQPQPMSFEEQLAHDWRHSPSLRREFTSFGSYQAYMRAAESGRCRAYGGMS